jgi:hypothetical protein
MQDDLSRLQRDVRALKLYAFVLTGLALVLGMSGFRGHSEQDQVLRARGLVIVDAAGRERVLIGAPIPNARNRVRTDTSRVRDVWGRRFPSQYMEWYRGYRHNVNGMLVLDERGFDRVAVGDSLPDANIGRRIGPSTGLVINDAQGFERSGYGLLTVAGRDRMVLGLDDARSQEGVVLFVADSGRAGIAIKDGADGAYLGTAPANDPMLNTNTRFVGLLLKRGPAQHSVTVPTRRP